jgi:arylsulfatase A-like enzyme
MLYAFHRRKASTEEPPAFWPAFCLAIVLVATKAFYLEWLAADPPDDLSSFVRALAAISYGDVCYAATLGFFHRLALAPRRPYWLRTVGHLFFCLIYLLSAVYGVVDLVVFGFFLTPLTYPLLCLSGDLASFVTSVAPFLSFSLLFAAVASLFCLTQLAALSDWATSASSPRARRVLRATLLVLAVVWSAAGRHEFFDGWNHRIDRRVAENAHATFLVSLLKAAIGEAPILLSDPVLEPDRDDFLTVAERGTASTTAGLLKKVSLSTGLPFRQGRVRNVVLLVLESVSARWLELYGSPYKATPNLTEEARHALVFADFYSPAGRSSDALASLLLSVQPRMSWRDVTSDFPRLPGASLAEVLKERGYRTAFVTSSDLSWENWKGFLADRGFDTIWQGSDLDCTDPLSSWGVEDRCMIDGAERWIARDPTKPFFLMAWTVQTHHPYEPTPGRPLTDFFGNERPTDDYDFGRYLNVLAETDRQLGRLFLTLRQRGLEDDTLVVIVGDHGEAFGHPHEAYGHGTALYEENVHVPMILWSPRLFPHGGRSPIIGSHLDLNQTITDVLGVPPAGSWQGRSLFDPARRPRAYFFVANDAYQMGVREEGWKYILDATNGREELYDLRADRDEQMNRAPDHPEICKRLRQRLAARAEADRRFFAGLSGSAAAL